MYSLFYLEIFSLPFQFYSGSLFHNIHHSVITYVINYCSTITLFYVVLLQVFVALALFMLMFILITISVIVHGQSC